MLTTKAKAARSIMLIAGFAALGCRTVTPPRNPERSTASVPVVGADTLDARLHAVRARIERMVAAESLPSVAVGVAQRGVIMWQQGFGLADRERKVAATAHTPYLLASITKSITATALMTLVQRGVIELDAPIERYLGGIQLSGRAGKTSDVTARRILAHSAGLPTHYRVVLASQNMPAASETLRRYGVVTFPPGEYFEYSNIGYRAIDVAVATVSGRSYEEFLRAEVFAPLGMQRSTFNADARLIQGAAALYETNGASIPLYRSDHPGSGDVWSSAHDMLRFGMFHVGTLLPSQRAPLTTAMRLVMQRDASPTEVQWGLGWMLSRDRGHRVVSHGGGQPGVSTQLLMYPDSELVIIVLSNVDMGPVGAIAQQIANALLPAVSDSVVATPASTVSPPPIDSTTRWAGTIVSHDIVEPISMTRLADGDFRATLGRQLLSSIVRDPRFSAKEFTGSMSGILGSKDLAGHTYQLTFRLVPQGRYLVGQLTARGTDAIFGLSSFVRLERVDEAFVEQYLGSFKHADNDIRSITREGDRLYSQRGSGRKYEMEAVGADLFRLSGGGGSVLRFERTGTSVSAVELVGSGRAVRIN